VRKAVELKSSALCWLDVGGGLNPRAGQKHINLMKVGMESAFVAGVIFLSDGYLKSANCKRELWLALSNYKHPIPVLMPPTAISLGLWMMLASRSPPS
jgi:hypothetical protein